MKLTEKNKNSLWTAASGVLCLVCLLTFILTPLAGDLKVFAASARQAELIGKNWIYNAYNAWELKSVFSRTLIYLLYKMAAGVTGFGNHSFETGFKLVYMITAVLLLAASVWLGEADRSRKEKIPLLFFLCIILFSPHVGTHMQVEMTCTILLLFAFALYKNAVKTGRRMTGKLLAAGLLIGSTFFFKSVLILMSVSFVAAAYLWDVSGGYKPEWKRFWLLVLGSVLMLLAGMASILLINPEEISDILAASVFQETLFSAGGIPVKVICFYGSYQFLINCMRIPGMMVGVTAGILNFTADVKDRRPDRLFMRFVLWMIPAAFIILSNKYMIYHYYVFLFPAVMELMLLKKENGFPAEVMTVLSVSFLTLPVLLPVNLLQDLFRKAGVLAVCLCILCAAVSGFFRWKKGMRICFLLSVLTAGVIYFQYLSIFSVNFRDYARLSRTAYAWNEEVLASVQEEEMLYLDDGIAAYLFGARSCLKYYYPLPLQRIDADSEHSRMPCYTESKEKVMAYDGDWIAVYEDWFFENGKNEDIREKLEREYEKAGEYVIYTPGDEIFTKSDETMIRSYDLYRRKDLS